MNVFDYFIIYCSSSDNCQWRREHDGGGWVDQSNQQVEICGSVVRAGKPLDLPGKESQGWECIICLIYLISGGAGGKGTWGKLGDEMDLPWVDPNDPNYDSDREEAKSCSNHPL